VQPSHEPDHGVCGREHATGVDPHLPGKAMRAADLAGSAA
jgi:hypothetical protein